MAQLVSNQFHAALTHLLAQEGRGTQTRLAKQQKIDRGYLNAIVKGRKPGSENIRAKIADYFNMAYEEMLIFGRHILNKTKNPTPELNNREKLSPRENSQPAGSGKEIIDFSPSLDNDEVLSSIPDKIVKAIEILESGTTYGELLAGQIDAFHEAIKSKEENLVLRNQTRELESRVDSLEKIMGGKKECGRKSA